MGSNGEPINDRDAVDLLVGYIVAEDGGACSTNGEQFPKDFLWHCRGMKSLMMIGALDDGICSLVDWHDSEERFDIKRGKLFPILQLQVFN